MTVVDAGLEMDGFIFVQKENYEKPIKLRKQKIRKRAEYESKLGEFISAH